MNKLKPDYTCGQKFATFYREDIPSCLRAVADFLEQNDLEIATGLIDIIQIGNVDKLDQVATDWFFATLPYEWTEKHD